MIWSMHEFGHPAWHSLSSRFWANHLYAYSETGPVNQYVQTHERQYSCLAWPVREGKMSAAPVWFWGGSYRTARKTALTEASVCVIVGLQEERVGGDGWGENAEREGRGERRVRRNGDKLLKRRAFFENWGRSDWREAKQKETHQYFKHAQREQTVCPSLSGSASKILIRGPPTWGYMRACFFASWCPKCPFVKAKF